MSTSYERGKEFETRLAKSIRTKLGIKAYRDPKSGAGWFKGDIRMPTMEWHLEAKSQNYISLREWWHQTELSTPPYKSPVLAIDNNGYTQWAVLNWEDFLNLLKTIQDDTNTIMELRERLVK